jgi:hypothetical protein
MKRVYWSALFAGVLMISMLAPAAAQDTVTIDMREVDGSGQFGSADVTSDGEQTIISIEIEPGEAGVPQPAHIHYGSCNDLGDVAYPLDDVVDGVSESTADVSISELIGREYAINVHLSEEEMGVSVSCGTLPLIPSAAPDDEADDAVEEDDATEEADDEEAVEEADDATTEDDEEADDVAALLPATGSIGGASPETAVMLMVLLAGAAMGVGVAIRRRTQHA